MDVFMVMLEGYRNLIFEALKAASEQKIDIYTFAMYHDHESGFVTICIDTKQNSDKSVISQNRYSRDNFLREIEGGNLEMAGLWQANGGRSFSLGNFSFVDFRAIEVTQRKKQKGFYLAMIKAIEEMSELIQRSSSHGSNLIYCCSTEKDEVGLIWSPNIL